MEKQTTTSTAGQGEKPSADQDCDAKGNKDKGEKGSLKCAEEDDCSLDPDGSGYDSSSDDGWWWCCPCRKWVEGDWECETCPERERVWKEMMESGDPEKIEIRKDDEATRDCGYRCDRGCEMFVENGWVLCECVKEDYRIERRWERKGVNMGVSYPVYRSAKECREAEEWRKAEECRKRKAKTECRPIKPIKGRKCNATRTPENEEK